MKRFIVIAISIAILFAGCKKKKEDEITPGTPNNNPNPTVTVNSPAQVSFKLDGTAISYIEGSTYQQTVGSSFSSATPPDSSESSWSCGFEDVSMGNPIFELEKGYLNFLGNMPDSDVYYNFFNPGNYNYVMDPDMQMGVRLAYYIGADKWSTYDGTANQTGSVFKIIDRKKFWSLGGNTGATVLINFNCILHDNNGNTKTVTDGVMVCSFENL